MTANLGDTKFSSTIKNKLSLEELYELKYQTISDETKLTEKMNATIKNGGLSKSSKLAIQNVKEAIAVSKKPFYTETIGYYFKFYYFSNLSCIIKLLFFIFIKFQSTPPGWQTMKVRPKKFIKRAI